jgi:tagatose-1,6-bisphosphate aldolase
MRVRIVGVLCGRVLPRAVVHERLKATAEDLAEIVFERLKRRKSVSHLSIINECACES